ncbi:MAG TPA: hypothetical protein VOA87_10980 [Thermoanaerobaculia bacterium]|nr:hypothetical protein [Thermoanaerobaculia bacterium]
MDINFAFNFTGLCAFVPIGGSHRVVLINARDGMSADMVHVAALLVPVGQYDTNSTRQPDKTFDGSNGHFENSSMYAFYLNDDDLALSAVGTNVPAPAIATPTRSCPQEGVDDNSFAWVANMADLGTGTMSADHYSGRHPAKVLARIDIPAGITPATRDFALTTDSKNIVRWNFKDSNGNQTAKPRALAEVVGIAISVSAQPVKITSISNNWNILLKPGFGSRISIWLVNMPELDILTDRNDPKNPRQPDAHFAMFYKMASPTGTVFIPNPLDNCGPPGTGMVSNPKCPPALFSAHLDAVPSLKKKVAPKKRR